MFLYTPPLTPPFRLRCFPLRAMRFGGQVAASPDLVQTRRSLKGEDGQGEGDIKALSP